MSSSHRAALLTAGAGLMLVSLLGVSPTAGAGSDEGGTPPPTASSAPESLRDLMARPGPSDRDPLRRASRFLGHDGKMHDPAPLLVRGRHGTKYFGEEFDAACGYGPKFARAVQRLAQLARVIEKSGRRVIFTIGPNKSAVNLRDLRTDRLPHGRCDLKGLRQQNQILDRFDDRNYLPMREALAEEAAHRPDGRNFYWPIDTHWTLLSTARYALALAERLSPRIAAAQSFRSGKETIETDLSTIGLIPKNYETGPARYSTTPVLIKHPRGDGYRWSTKPARLTWPGRTALVGTSFTYRGLDSLRPLFRHARFLWIDPDYMHLIVNEIPKSDTVILEVVQRWLPISPLTRRSFLRDVRQALAEHDRARR